MPSPLPTIRRLVLGAALAATTLLPVTAAPASAASPRLQGDAGVRPCIDLENAGCAPVATVPRGTSVTMECWQDGSWETGAYATNRWFFVSAGGRRGFVHASWVIDQAKVGSCKENRGIGAARWAGEHIGRTKPTPAEAGRIGIDDGRWSGWCAGFTYGAYLWGDGVTPRFAGNAAPRYEAYRQAGLVSGWSGAGNVPVGAMVFWPDVAAPYGHTALYVGDGMVISTQGLSDPSRPVGRVPVDTWGTPAGWVASDMV